MTTLNTPVRVLVSPPGVPVRVVKDTTVRIKIIDSCGLSCQFCHNEGTPVAADNRTTPAQQYTSTGPSGRVSIYLGRNGADFIATAIPPDATFVQALRSLKSAIEVDEVHFTGGEPTLHPGVSALVAAAVGEGLRVRMTSNGENGARVIPACAEAGLDAINFSIFGTTPDELLQVQGAKLRNTRLAERKIGALQESITACLDYGVAASANIVVPGPEHAPRVRRLLDNYAPELSVRLLNSLDDGQASLSAIADILSDLRAVPVAHYVTAGASGSRTAYRLPNGRTIYVKHIRPTRLPDTCTGCRYNNDTDCQEGFYGIRLYRDQHGTYQVGVCIQRMDLCRPLPDFSGSGLCHEINSFRDTEYQHWTRTHATP